MKIEILDTQATYRQLLDTADAAEREALYRTEVLEPFAGMFRVMGGGGDPLELARGWSLYGPDDFVGEARPRIVAMLDQLAAVDAKQQVIEPVMNLTWRVVA